MPRPVANGSRTRQTTQLNLRLDKSLAAYMAAGIGLLASSLPARAKVVYTPAHGEINPTHGLSLDLTNNGVVDFIFSDFYSSTSSTLALSINPANSNNEVFSTGANHLSVFAAAIPAGMEIGPNGKFTKRPFLEMANGIGTQPICHGPWVHANDRYLGLKFIINGETHFGWARLDVHCVYPHPVTALLTGYAYETVANKPLVTGQTHGPDANNAGSLGSLARGTALSYGHDQ
jgi:hypothetical protein